MLVAQLLGATVKPLGAKRIEPAILSSQIPQNAKRTKRSNKDKPEKKPAEQESKEQPKGNSKGQPKGESKGRSQGDPKPPKGSSQAKQVKSKKPTDKIAKGMIIDDSPIVFETIDSSNSGILLTHNSTEERHGSNNKHTLFDRCNASIMKQTLWTQIFRPQSVSEVFGHHAAKLELNKFILARQRNEYSSYQCCFVMGPTVGKTSLSQLILESNGYHVIVIHPSKLLDISAGSSSLIVNQGGNHATVAKRKQGSEETEDLDSSSSGAVESCALLNFIYNHAINRNNLSGRKIALLLENIDGDSWSPRFLNSFEKLLILHELKVQQKFNDIQTEIQAQKKALSEHQESISSVAGKTTTVGAGAPNQPNKRKTQRNHLSTDLVKLQHPEHLFPQLPTPYHMPLICPIICTLKDGSRDKLKRLKKKVIQIPLNAIAVNDLIKLGENWLRIMNRTWSNSWLNGSSTSSARVPQVTEKQQVNQVNRVNMAMLSKYRSDLRKFCNDLQFDSISTDQQVGPIKIPVEEAPVNDSINDSSIIRDLERGLSMKNSFQFHDWLWSKSVREELRLYMTEPASHQIHRAFRNELLPFLHEHYVPRYKTHSNTSPKKPVTTITVKTKAPTPTTMSVTPTTISLAVKKKDLEDWMHICDASTSLTMADKYNEFCLPLNDWRFNHYSSSLLFSQVIGNSPVNLTTNFSFSFPPQLFLIFQSVRNRKNLLQLITNPSIRRLDYPSRLNEVLITLIRHWFGVAKTYWQQTQAPETVPSKHTCDLKTLQLLPNKMKHTFPLCRLGCVDDASETSLTLYKALLSICGITQASN